jgi:hypothetical protein
MRPAERRNTVWITNGSFKIGRHGPATCADLPCCGSGWTGGNSTCSGSARWLRSCWSSTHLPMPYFDGYRPRDVTLVGTPHPGRNITFSWAA